MSAEEMAKKIDLDDDMFDFEDDEDEESWDDDECDPDDKCK